jgi:hypothetical protein
MQSKIRLRLALGEVLVSQGALGKVRAPERVSAGPGLPVPWLVLA